MLGALFLILACQLAGEVTVRLTSLPVPGPVIGMVFLFIWLCFRRHVSDGVDTVTGTLLSNMSLLFVPAGVGVIRYADQIFDEALAILVSIVAGTVITITLVAWLGQRFMPPHHHANANGEGE